MPSQRMPSQKIGRRTLSNGQVGGIFIGVILGFVVLFLLMMVYLHSNRSSWASDPERSPPPTYAPRPHPRHEANLILQTFLGVTEDVKVSVDQDGQRWMSRPPRKKLSRVADIPRPPEDMEEDEH